ncbi:MAG: hypothetical protein EBQ87_13720 [Planctomycetes bacterium]|nr:hypothetical protein [Planctomycetota bacterium]
MFGCHFNIAFFYSLATSQNECKMWKLGKKLTIPLLKICFNYSDSKTLNQYAGILKVGKGLIKPNKNL